MDSTTTTLFIGCILLLNVKLSSFVSAQLAPVDTGGAAGAPPGGAVPGGGGGAGGAPLTGAPPGGGTAGAPPPGGGGAAGASPGGGTADAPLPGGGGAAGAPPPGGAVPGGGGAAGAPPPGGGGAAGAPPAGGIASAPPLGGGGAAGAPPPAGGTAGAPPLAGGSTVGAPPPGGSGTAGALHPGGGGATGAPGGAPTNGGAAAPGAGAGSSGGLFPGAPPGGRAGLLPGRAPGAMFPGRAPGAMLPGGALGGAGAPPIPIVGGTTSSGNISGDGYKIPNVTGPPIVPCYFIFGDSLADSGNNNNLTSLAKANFLPYGIDYPTGPTGRFTNGRTYVDFVAEFLGFDHHIAPYAAIQGTEKVLQGINYASGSAGIRPETGKIVGDRVALDVQLEHHKATIAKIKELKGNDEAAVRDYLGKCLYTVNMGSNDYMVNYLLAPANPNDVVYTPDSWAQDLATRMHDFIKNIHDLGAKKVALYGLGPVGCEPSQVKALRMAGKQGCVENVNHIVSLYNQRLPPIVDELNKNLPDAKFIFINTTHTSPVHDAAKLGVKFTDQPCCPTGPAAGVCTANKPPCAERGDYSFFDQYHPTEKVVRQGAQRAWQAVDPEDNYPMDISRLVRLP